ncbi:MAG: hypothetical protein EOM20_17465, partial [Spartobacteria bacterium]|nr:hypothetical protein [Spartobacteria bacterium]
MKQFYAVLKTSLWTGMAVLAVCSAKQATAAPGDYRVLTEFAASETVGGKPVASPINVGGTLYGMTPYGGVSNWGVIYAVQTVSSNYTTLHSFQGLDGRTPLGRLAYDGTNLYGMTCRGGSNDAGVVFRVDTNGVGFTVLHHFDGQDPDNGANPWGAPVWDGNRLYGLTYGGGWTNNGVAFALATDGSGYTNLHRFIGPPVDGEHPKSDLLLDAGRLYGTTCEGGTNDKGTVFAMDTDGGNYALLYEFTGQAGDGQFPGGPLIKEGDYLYGTAIGGQDNAGVAFCLHANGGTMNHMWFFSGLADDGASPYAGLIKHDTKVYGVTRYGGSHSVGVLFSLGGDHTNQYTWPAGGGEPVGNLLASGDEFYGTTLRGGADNNGVLYAFEMDTNDTPEAWCALTWIENGALADVLEGDMPSDRMWVRHNTAGGLPTYAFVGYGLTDNADDDTWTWTAITNYSIVNGGADYEYTATFSRASGGDYVIAAKFIKGMHVYYNPPGLSAWGSWDTALYATNDWTVTPLTAPSNVIARYVSTNQIDVAFNNDGSHWVAVFRKQGENPDFTEPVDGVEYYSGTVYEAQGECLYRGDSPPFNDNELPEDTVYAYRLYTENWSFYSTGTWASASTDPDRDDDTDGMPNAYETIYDFDPGDPLDGIEDADGDGPVNWQEYIAGTDPTNAASLLEITDAEAETNNQFALTWSSVNGKQYTLWRATNLVEGFTSSLSSNIVATAPANTYTDTVGVVT